MLIRISGHRHRFVPHTFLKLKESERAAVSDFEEAMNVVRRRLFDDVVGLSPRPHERQLKNALVESPGGGHIFSAHGMMVPTANPVGPQSFLSTRQYRSVGICLHGYLLSGCTNLQVRGALALAAHKVPAFINGRGVIRSPNRRHIKPFWALGQIDSSSCHIPDGRDP
jgi:hypothetical protein